MTEKTTPAGDGPAERRVRQPWPRPAIVGDTIICGVRNPYPGTIAMKLETPAAVAYANKLIASKKSGWRLVELKAA